MTARALQAAGRRLSPRAWTALAVGAAAAAVRLPRALGDPFWQDEVASARILREPTLGGVLDHVARTESTPPLWYVLGWAAHRAGVSIHDVRLLSVAFGALLAGLVVVLARRLVPLPQAALAGTLVAVGGHFVAHGRELRAYELLALLAVAFAFALLARRPAALAACTAAGALTHYFFLFTVAAGLVWLWVDPEARAARRRATVAIAVGLAVCLPWLPVALRQFRANRFSWIGPFDGRTVLATAGDLFTPLAAVAPVAVAALAVACAGAILLWRRPGGGRLCALLALLPLAFAAAVWLAGFRIFAVRNMVEIGPFLAIAIAAAIAAIPARAAAAATALVAVAALAGFAWNQRVPTPPYDRIARALVAEGWRANDRVAVFGNFFAFRSPLEWYLPRSPLLARAGSACDVAYAIAGPRAARRLVGRRATVGRFAVVRLLHPAELLRGAIVLAAPRARRCA